ncbi:uncharacterized protein TNCV_5101671 [Trichonephila clavipes]|nr:uncharacterized protein TNCV_5101671 [Trichonephila clavipes]
MPAMIRYLDHSATAATQNFEMNCIVVNPSGQVSEIFICLIVSTVLLQSLLSNYEVWDVISSGIYPLLRRFLSIQSSQPLFMYQPNIADPQDFEYLSMTPNTWLSDLHWCAKIKDEVEKLAYLLNEEAEWTERPIRRLSKVMYGSTLADMQVDVMGECLSSIKHVVGVRSVFLAKRLHSV